MSNTHRPELRGRWTIGILIALMALALLAPFQSFVYIVLLMSVMYLALFAASINLLLGWGGLLSFGHAAFFGTSAYVAVYSSSHWGFTPELALLSGTIAASLLGLLMGLVAIRRQGVYFAMITLALSQMVYFIAAQLPATGGDDGLKAPRGHLFGVIDLKPDAAMYYVVLVVFAAAMWLIYRIVRSPLGDVLTCIRENEPRATSLGYDVDRVKLMAFVISAGLAGLAGGLKGLVLQLATLADLHWHTSGEGLVMAILGGIGTFAGPVAGAVIQSILEHHLSELGALSVVATGFIFMACVTAFRRGVVGEILARLPQSR